MASKHTNTEYNRYQRLNCALRDIYSSAIAFSSSFDEFLGRKRALYASWDYQKLTNYYRGKLDGVSETLWAMLYGSHNGAKPPLMHVNIGPDGRVFPEFSEDWLPESSEYKSSMKCEHVWRGPYMKDGSLCYWSKSE